MKKLTLGVVALSTMILWAGSAIAQQNPPPSTLTSLNPPPGTYAQAICLRAGTHSTAVTRFSYLVNGKKAAVRGCLMLSSEGIVQVRAVGLDKDGNLVANADVTGEYTLVGSKVTHETFSDVAAYQAYIAGRSPCKKSAPAKVAPAAPAVKAEVKSTPPPEVVDTVARASAKSASEAAAAAQKAADEAMTEAKRPRGPQLKWVTTGDPMLSMAGVPYVRCMKLKYSADGSVSGCENEVRGHLLSATHGDLRSLEQKVKEQAAKSPFTLAPELGYLYARAGGATDKYTTTVVNLSWKTGSGFDAFVGLGGAWEPDAGPSLLFQGGVEVWSGWVGFRAQAQLALLDLTGSGNGELFAVTAGPVFRYQRIYGGIQLGGGTRFLPNGDDAGAFVANLFAGYRF